MTTVDIKALREKSADELKNELLALTKEKFNLYMQRGSGQPVKADAFGKVKKSNCPRENTYERKRRECMTATQSEQSKKERTRVGKVTSDKMSKTIVVLVERKEKHPFYNKYVRRFSKLKAHDANNDCRMGDIVLIAESRPLSKTKRWKLVEIIKREEV